jgi:hypothetical protein
MGSNVLKNLDQAVGCWRCREDRQWEPQRERESESKSGSESEPAVWGGWEVQAVNTKEIRRGG